MHLYTELHWNTLIDFYYSNKTVIFNSEVPDKRGPDNQGSIVCCGASCCGDFLFEVLVYWSTSIDSNVVLPLESQFRKKNEKSDRYVYCFVLVSY